MTRIIPVLRWAWPLVLTHLLVALGVLTLRLAPDAVKGDLYLASLLYVGLVSLVILLLMVGMTRVWTVLALGLLVSFGAIALWELAAALARGWLRPRPAQQAWTNDLVAAGLVVGATLALIGMIGNVRRGGGPIQPWRAYDTKDGLP